MSSEEQRKSLEDEWGIRPNARGEQIAAALTDDIPMQHDMNGSV